MTQRPPRRHFAPVLDTAPQNPHRRGRCDRAEGAPYWNPYTNVDDRADYDRGYRAVLDPAAARPALAPPPSAAARAAKLPPNQCRTHGGRTR